ncbi:MAG: HEPN domain-containing protein [Gemmatimonadetes bacterium]|nr:HEPN domain-containing protein [Gemmatimonadota bacterium]
MGGSSAGRGGSLRARPRAVAPACGHEKKDRRRAALPAAHPRTALLGGRTLIVRNLDLARDYVHRADVRVRALDVLFQGESWADVVRESQEVVELALKGLLRSCGIAPPRVHDVSEVLEAERERLPEALVPEIPTLVRASRELRRDRELAFYGAEDLTPSGFYSREDAERARSSARRAVELVKPHVLGAAQP